jgi:hypothetical protein
MTDFQALVDVVPDLNRPVFRAGDNQLLPDAHIKAGDLLGVEGAMNILKLWS